MNKYLTQNFTIGNAVITPKKGHVELDGQIKKLEPKVLAVLALLAERPNQVISQEEIFEIVWPGSIYSPSSVQRCIAILRKELNDNAKEQTIIVTHPKRGYSLRLTPVLSTTDNSSSFQKWGKLAGLSIVLIALCCFYYFHTKTQENTFHIREMQPLTAGKYEEKVALYSPSGAYISYIRKTETGEQQLILESVTTTSSKRVYTTTANVLYYSWGKDDSSMLLVLQRSDTLSINRVSHSSDNTSIHLTPLLVLDSKSQISNIQWDKGEYVFYLQKQRDVQHLIQHQLVSDTKHILARTTMEFKLYGLSLSADGQQLALLGFDKKFSTLVKLLTLATHELKHLFTLKSNVYTSDWHPRGHSLLLSDGKHLFLLSLTGQLQQLAFENFQYIQSAKFTADASAIVVELVDEDADLSLVDTISGQSLTTNINSSNNDWAASISGNGQYIAFISERKGFPQIYTYNLYTQQTQLVYANEQKHLYLSIPIWHPTENIFASAGNDIPFLIDLNDTQHKNSTLDNLHGQPQQFSSDGKFLYLREQSRLSPQIIQVRLSDTSIYASYTFDNKWVHISQTGQILAIRKDSIGLYDHSGQIIDEVKVKGKIINSILDEASLYIQIQDKQEQFMLKVSATTLQISQQQELHKDINIVWDKKQRQNLSIKEKLNRRSRLVLLKGN